MSVVMDELDPVFDALANGHRRAIIHALGIHPQSISQLAALRGLSLPAIHKHIRVLENAEMVRRRKIGRTNFLALNRAPLQRLTSWVEQFHPWWGTDGESLENYTPYLSEETQVAKKSS